MEFTVDCEVSSNGLLMPECLRDIVLEYLGGLEIHMLRLLNQELGEAEYIRRYSDDFAIKTKKCKIKLYPEVMVHYINGSRMVYEELGEHLQVYHSFRTLKEWIVFMSESFHKDFGYGRLKCSVCKKYIDAGVDKTTEIFIEINIPLKLSDYKLNENGNVTVCKKYRTYSKSEYEMYSFKSKLIGGYEPYTSRASKIYVLDNSGEFWIDEKSRVFAIMKRKNARYFYIFPDYFTNRRREVLRIKKRESIIHSVEVMSIKEAFDQLERGLHPL